MRYITSPRVTLVSLSITAVCLVALAVFFMTTQTFAADASAQPAKRLLTVHDRGSEHGFMTNATTVRAALAQSGVTIADTDLVEPGLDEKLVANSYQINIYRARPMLVVDGTLTRKILSPYQTASQIAEHAGLHLQDEDKTTIEPIRDIATNGPGIQMTIDRATPFTLVLYGTKTQAYTQATTVGDMLRDKSITRGEHDTVTVPDDTPITAGMTVAIWRDGAQTLTEDQPIDFAVERVFDTDQPVGYRAIKTAGVAGTETVAYEVVMDGGKEVSRTKIQSVVTKQPVKQIEVVGVKTGAGALTKSKGAQQFVDSNGVSHRETYYDLAMNIVMNACGGGTYTVRADGAKVDKDGYVLVAANLANYPRCSVVETSLGPGKVYDTGGFAAVHPHGFDLATDWSNNDGR